jgi:L-asparagine oxygenase
MKPHEPDILASLTTQGFAFIPGFHPEENTLSASERVGVAARLPGLAEIQKLLPRDKETSPPNIYSGNFGCDEFPLHTDLAHWFVPPRYFLLRCINGAPGVSTRLLDGSSILRTFGEPTLRRTLVKPRRAINGARPVLPLLEGSAARGYKLRWDNLFIVPATPHSAKVYGEICVYLSAVKPIDLQLRGSADTLVVDNWRMLHGRSAITPENQNRHIERVYLKSI